ncbi:MAG: arginase family protein [Candidatus Solibacter sp.]
MTRGGNNGTGLDRPFIVKRSLQAKFLGRDSGLVRLKGPDPELEVFVSEAVAECLESLASPVELSTFSSRAGMGRDTLAKLLHAGLLLEAGPDAAQPSELTPFFPRFLGCPVGAVGEAQISVIGAPCDILSQTGSGARGGPAGLRVASSQIDYTTDPSTGRPRGWYDSASARQILAGTTFADAGDIQPGVGESASHFGTRLTRAVRTCVALGSLPVLLGGDHSISYWAVSALRGVSRDPVSVLHLDAHSDLSERTGTGAPANGSVARWLIEEFPGMPFVTVGLRGYLGAKQPLLSSSHHLVSAADLIRNGPELALSFLPESMPCYVSFDIDVLDPSVAPGTNVPLPGGFSFEKLRDFLTCLASRRRLAGVDIVELNPERDPYSRSASAAVHLLLALLASSFPTSAEDSIS